MSNEWLDEFLFIDFVLVTLLVFFDWMVGKERRKEMKESVANWYLYLSDASYGKLISDDVNKIYKLLVRYFGDSTFSRRRLLSSFVASLLITLIVIILLSIFLFTADEIKYIKVVFLTVSIPNMLTDRVSLSISILLLQWMIRKPSVHRYMLIIILDIVLAIILLFIAIFLTTFLINQLPLEPSKFLFSEHKGAAETILAAIVILFTAALPTLVHALYAFYLIFSKATGAIIRGPVSLVMLRLHESEKGVLTQISIGLGVLAKVIQETYKYIQS